MNSSMSESTLQVYSLWLFSFWIHGTCLYTCNMGKPQKGTCFWSSWCYLIHRYPECSFILRWSYLSIQGVPGWWHIIIEPRCIEHAPTRGQHSFVKGSTTISWRTHQSGWFCVLEGLEGFFMFPFVAHPRSLKSQHWRLVEVFFRILELYTI